MATPEGGGGGDANVLVLTRSDTAKRGGVARMAERTYLSRASPASGGAAAVRASSSSRHAVSPRLAAARARVAALRRNRGQGSSLRTSASPAVSSSSSAAAATTVQSAAPAGDAPPPVPSAMSAVLSDDAPATPCTPAVAPGLDEIARSAMKLRAPGLIPVAAKTAGAETKTSTDTATTAAVARLKDTTSAVDDVDGGDGGGASRPGAVSGFGNGLGGRSGSIRSVNSAGSLVDTSTTGAGNAPAPAPATVTSGTYTVRLTKGASGLGLNLGVRDFRVVVSGFRRDVEPLPAEACGRIEIGDVLLSIDGEIVRPCSTGESGGMEDVFRLLQASAATVEFRFLRGWSGGELTAEGEEVNSATGGTKGVDSLLSPRHGAPDTPQPFPSTPTRAGGVGRFPFSPVALPATPGTPASGILEATAGVSPSVSMIAAAAAASSPAVAGAIGLSPSAGGGADGSAASPIGSINGATALAALRASGCLRHITTPTSEADAGLIEAESSRDPWADATSDARADNALQGGNDTEALQQRLCRAQAQIRAQQREIEQLRASHAAVPLSSSSAAPLSAAQRRALLGRALGNAAAQLMDLDDDASGAPSGSGSDELLGQLGEEHAAWRQRWREHSRRLLKIAAEHAADAQHLRRQLRAAKRTIATARARTLVAQRESRRLCTGRDAARRRRRQRRRDERQLRAEQQRESELAKTVEGLPAELAALVSPSKQRSADGVNAAFTRPGSGDELESASDSDEAVPPLSTGAMPPVPTAQEKAEEAEAERAFGVDLRRSLRLVLQDTMELGATTSDKVEGANGKAHTQRASGAISHPVHKLAEMRRLLEEAEGPRRRARELATSCCLGGSAALPAAVSAGAKGVGSRLPAAAAGADVFDSIVGATLGQTVPPTGANGADANADGAEGKEESAEDWFERQGIPKTAEEMQLKELGTNKLAELYIGMRTELLSYREECARLKAVLMHKHDKDEGASEWREIVDLEEPSPHAFDSQVIQHVIESWFEEQRRRDFFQAQKKRDFVTRWLRHLVENEGATGIDGFPTSVTFSSLSAEVKEAFLKMVVPLLLHRKDLEVRVAERLRFTVSTDLCVQAQPIDTLFSETAGVKLEEQIPELPAPPSTSPLTAHRRLMQQKEQKQQQLDARKLQNIIKSRLLGPGSGGPTLLPPGASAAQGAVDRGGAEQLQQAGSAMAKFVRARVEAGAGGMAAMLGRKE